MEPINPNRTARWTRVCSLDHLVYGHQPFAERTLRNIWPRSRRSLRLDVRRTDHLGPLLGIFGDELAEVGRRTLKDRYAQGGKSRLDLGISEGGIDFLVEFPDNFYGCGFVSKMARFLGFSATPFRGVFSYALWLTPLPPPGCHKPSRLHRRRRGRREPFTVLRT